MAVYKIFPEKDATLYSEYVTTNTGMDEILEIASYSKGGTSYVNRTLIQFDSAEVAEVLNTLVSSSNRAATDFSASLKLYLAEANEVPTSYTIFAHPTYVPTYASWINGNGKYGDIPINTSGVSWEFSQGNSTGTWTAVAPTYVTASSSSSQEGGGAWYTGSAAYNFNISQSHTVASTHDININVTAGVKAHYAGAIANAGYLLKLDPVNEYQTARQIYLKYFGIDTHTIYPPCLEIKWNDFVNSNSLPEISDPACVIKVKNNRGEYTDEGRQRFEILVRPKYPIRTFATSSNYLNNFYLPTGSYWGLRDENSEEMVIDFDTQFTKISRGTTANHFDVYMGGLEPERYYRILVKTTINGSTNIIDENMVFKVVRNG